MCRHRKAREAKILHAIEQGAHEAFDIVSRVYADTPTSLWMSALSNVILHVDHLNHLEKLPKVGLQAILNIYSHKIRVYAQT